MSKLKKWGIILFIITIFALPLLGRILNLYLDWLWFEEVGFERVFLKILFNKMGLGIGIGFTFFVFLWFNFWLAQRPSSLKALRTGRNLFEIPHQELIKPYLSLILLIGSLFFAFLAGSAAVGKWDSYLKFFYPSSFGITDPLFLKDISFYVFKLPFLSYLYYTSLFFLILTSLVTGGIYLFQEAICLTERGISLIPKVKKHFSGLAFLLCSLLAVGCWLKSYQLLYSTRGIVFGAGYVDVHACFPVLKILSVMCLLTALLFFLNLFIHKFKWTLIVALATIAVSIIGLGIFPMVIQKFQVAPNEITMEKEYIKRSIKFTQAAYNLDEVQVNDFSVEEDLRREDIKKNDLTVRNIRLWDHGPLLNTYSQLQEIRTYYNFVDVDNDRYLIDGEYRQVMLSPRELSSEHLPSKVWINEHLTYTHGYGICLGPVNRISPEGLPEFMIKDIPPVSITDLVLKQPEIYYGEIANDYCFVKTKCKEFDYPAGDKNIYTTYQGQGGLPVKSIWRKILLALKFKELKIFFSTEITNQSKIMFYRQIKERIEKVTPFITYDADPYLVVSEGKLYWICDGYTTSNMYPYSEPTLPLGNYIRNSVKVVVDAYHGQMKFYVSDQNDPIVQSYSKIFPEVFLPLEKLSDDLRKHIRYPGTLLALQAKMYGAYHMNDPQVFYNKEDLWTIPKKMIEGTEQEMQPYYTIMKLEGQKKEEFILMIPFTPAKKDNMIAWMAARCDQPNYGKLLVYDFPKKKLVYGPSQIEARINQDAEISKQLSLWNQKGSQVIRGSLLVIPIEKSLLYVQPLYLAAENGQIPELKRVIVAFGNKIVMEENLDLSLKKLFGSEIEITTPKKSPKEEALVSTKELIRQAIDYFNKADSFMRVGNWAEYGQQLKELKRVLEKLEEK
ncbi:UPF0182 family protein [bacterium]|nr:UPF0182 family protein [bacterium]